MLCTLKRAKELHISFFIEVLGYETMSLGNSFLTFWDNIALSFQGSKCPMVLLGHFDLWRWDHCVILKHQKSITQWQGIISQEWIPQLLLQSLKLIVLTCYKIHGN